MHVYAYTTTKGACSIAFASNTEAVVGGEADEAQAQEDHEDVTTKEDAKPDGLVSAYWETIGQHLLGDHRSQCHAGVIQTSCCLSHQQACQYIADRPENLKY